MFSWPRSERDAWPSRSTVLAMRSLPTALVPSSSASRRTRATELSVLSASPDSAGWSPAASGSFGASSFSFSFSSIATSFRLAPTILPAGPA